jgi:uncharacterized GH25 family protein
LPFGFEPRLLYKEFDMTRFYSRSALVLALSLAAGLPMAAHAHRGWMMPSATVLSGNEPWVTVDAAISNDLFYFEHNAMNLDGLVVFAPDGSKATPENQGKGRYRSTFDVKLAQKGTYKIAVLGDSLNASYKLGGETKRARGTAESLAKDIPAAAENLSVNRFQSRNEVFVTSGKPTEQVLRPTGAGLELAPITHPNDLMAGETARFRFLLDGQPVAGIEVTVVPGGVRYRDQLGEIKTTTDAQGEFSIKWPGPGMYWLNASHGAMPRPPVATPGATNPPVAAGPVGTLQQPLRRTSYSATLEVLSQ